MKNIAPDSSWKQSWINSYEYDLIEIYGSNRNLGYTYAYQNRYKEVINLVTNLVKPGAKILDIAAAQGNFTLKLAELGYEVTWNDIREELVDYVKMKQQNGIVNYVSGNVFEIKFKELFDVVLATEVIEHTAHPDQFLYQVASLVKPGGYLLVTTPNGEYFMNKLPKFSDCPDSSIYENIQFKPNSDGHIFLLHLDEVRKLSQSVGLKIVSLKLITNPLTNGHVKLWMVLKFFPKAAIDFIEQVTKAFPLCLSKKINTTMCVLFQRPL